MTTEPKHRDWVKLWIKESLLGTIREDLTAEERGMWYDFLLLAGNSRIPGIICANEDSPLPIKRIAGILNVTEELVNQSIQKFLKSGRITMDNQGIIRIVNWSKYQYSDYERQKPYRQRKVTRNDTQAKAKYGEFQNVSLSDNELQKLKTKFGDSHVAELVDKLSEGIASRGYKYKSHYAAILAWSRRDIESQQTTKSKPLTQHQEQLKKVEVHTYGTD